jgi:hypothetical protein
MISWPNKYKRMARKHMENKKPADSGINSMA